MTSKNLLLESPLAPRELLDRLDAFGKEWRESKMPPALRSEGYYQCRARISAPTFALELEPQGRGPKIVWSGLVAPNGTGSRVEVVATQTRVTRWSYGVLFLVIVALWVTPQFLNGSFVFPIVGLLFMAVFVIGSIAWRESEQVGPCRAVLEHVTHAQPQIATAPPNER